MRPRFVSKGSQNINQQMIQVVEVKSSSIAGAGLGVFTLKPVAQNTIIGYFNGVHRHRKEVFSSGEESVYLVEGGHPNEMLDIPPEFTHWQNYQASTGVQTSRTLFG